MNDPSTPPPAPSARAGVIAIVASAIGASLAIAVAGGLLQVWPFVLMVTVAVATCAGLPLLAVLRQTRRHRAAFVVLSGFVTGAALPLLMTLLGPAADQASVGGRSTVIDGSYTAHGWLMQLRFAMLFGLAGVVAALVAWRLSLWLSPGDPRRRRARQMAVGIVTLAVAAGSLAVPSLYIDRSCHNPLRGGGTSIGPVASIELALPQRDWPALDDELKRFARQRDWSIQADRQPDTPFPWFQQSLCTEPGTQIRVMNNSPEPLGLAISVFQPQGGDSWQLPLRALQAKIEARWPGSTSYRYDQDASPLPPWAPPSPAARSR